MRAHTITARRAARLLAALLVLAAALAVAPPAGAYVYWTTAGYPEFGGGTIGRANLDGTGVNQSFITGAGNPLALDMAVGAGHVYWSSCCGPYTIGHANLDGTGVNQSFITVRHSVAVGGVAVGAGHLYWEGGSRANSTIARANLDGMGVDRSFISSGLGRVVGGGGRRPAGQGHRQADPEASGQRSPGSRRAVGVVQK